MSTSSEKARWTPDQQQAISVNDKNILVSAAAGSGKTAVLVERIINKITDPTSDTGIDNLLVVTFTKAAAAEMRERISAAISAAISADLNNTKLKRQLSLLSYADITTIDSFCLNLVKSNFHVLELDPNFSLSVSGDDAKMSMLKKEVIDDLFEELYSQSQKNTAEKNTHPNVENHSELFNRLCAYNPATGTTGFTLLAKTYSSRYSDDTLKQLLFTLCNKLSTVADPEGWLDKSLEKYTELIEDFENSEYVLTITQRLKIMASDAFAAIKKYHHLMSDVSNVQTEIDASAKCDSYPDVMSNAESFRGAQKYLYHNMPEVFERLYNDFGAIIQAKDWDTLYGIISSVSHDYGTNRGKSEHKEKIGASKDYAKTVIDSMEEVINADKNTMTSFIRENVMPVISALTDLIKLYSRTLLEKKHSKDFYAISDIESFALKLLQNPDGSPSDIARDLSRKYREILIDEYQDSNELQDTIFSLISAAGSARRKTYTFTVGDIKQSIYRFRSSDPTLFNKKSGEFPNIYESSDSEACKIILSKNFRSRSGVLDCINSVFKELMSEYVGEIKYDDEQQLNYGAAYPEPNEKPVAEKNSSPLSAVENNFKSEFFDIIIDGKEETSEDDSVDTDAVTTEARLIAARIKKLREDGFTVCGKDYSEHTIEYRDIAVLIRRNKVAAAFADELNRCGVPAFADTGDFFAKPEIRFFVSLLKAILNPMNDIAFIAVMRSVVGNFTDNDIAEIKLCGFGNMYTAVHNISCIRDDGEDNPHADKLSDELSDRLSVLKSTLSSDLVKKCRVLSDKFDRWHDYSEYMTSDKLIWTLFKETDYYSYVGQLTGGEEKQANLRLLFERSKNYENGGFKGLFAFVRLLDYMAKDKNNTITPAKLITKNHNVVNIMTIHKSKGLEFPVVFIAETGNKFNKLTSNENIVFHKDLGLGVEYIHPDMKYTLPIISKQAIQYKSELENISEEMRILYVAMTRAREKLIITGTHKISKTASKSKHRPMSLPADDMGRLNAGCYMNWLKPFSSDTRYWNYYNIPSSDINAMFTAAEDTQIENIQPEFDTSFDIGARFDWEYRFKKSPKIPSKVSVSELKRRSYEDAEDERTAQLFRDKYAYAVSLPKLSKADNTRLTGTQYGTAMHSVMQNIILTDSIDNAYIKSELDRMVSGGILTVKEAEAIKPEKIVRFFKSDLGKRILQSPDTLHRELPFEINISASEYDPSLGDEYNAETLVLQGIIDGYFTEKNGITLFDYKTDTYSDAEEIKNKYSSQLNYYSTALEKLLHKPVLKRYLYLFHKDELIQM